MLPVPNVLAGFLIGVACATWADVFISSAAWPLVYCFVVATNESARKNATLRHFGARQGSSVPVKLGVTFFAIEFFSALATALPVAGIVFAIKEALAN